MNHLRKWLRDNNNKNKSYLTYVYTSTDSNPKIYRHNDMTVTFDCPNYRELHVVSMYVSLHVSAFRGADVRYPLFFEDYVLRMLRPMTDELRESKENINKSPRDRATVESQQVSEHILRRNGARFDGITVTVKLSFRFALINGTYINAKPSIAMMLDVVRCIEKVAEYFDADDYHARENVYARQHELRAYIAAQGYCAFVADGSILPRENGTAAPKVNALPFKSPPELEVTVPLTDGGTLTGMAVRRGVTVVTGGGYSGKSTLLDAIEAGIYDHVSGDGREYVVTDGTALKIYAEDGRPVNDLNISPFFKFLPGDTDLRSFTTSHASGSVSQAANIIEAVCAGSRLLLIDEDRSATNFMIRDANMRKVVRNEPIIPFTDRVRELADNRSVSTILVIGGSSEYLSYADNVILMDAYVPSDVTDAIRELTLPPVHDEPPATWTDARRLSPKTTTQPFLFFRTVRSENAKRIVLDDYSADITLLTALTSEEQLNTLAMIMENLLTDKTANRAELFNIVAPVVDTVFAPEENTALFSVNVKVERWFEAVRVIDAMCCVNRMRGVAFVKML